MVYDKKENEGVKTKKSDANDKVNATTQTSACLRAVTLSTSHKL